MMQRIDGRLLAGLPALGVVSIAGVASLGLLATGCDATSEDVPSAAVESEVRASKVTAASPIPLLEVSALGVRKSGNGRELVAIGDRSRTLALAKLPAGEVDRDAASALTWRTLDLTTAIPSSLRREEASQWEGIAADEDGLVYVLEENPGHVFVFDVDGTRPKLLRTITIGKGEGEEGRAWEEDPNSRGEGLVLLPNGNILLAKEKSPRRLIELDPQGTPLRRWKLRDGNDLGDISDLATDGDRTFVLSDEGRRIARIETAPTTAPVNRDLNLVDKLSLPGTIEKPEGLVVVGTRFLVASDVACPGGATCANLFLVER